MLRNTEITIDFNGNLGRLCGVINNWLVNVSEDILKHYILQIKTVKFAKYLLWKTTFTQFLKNTRLLND